MAERKNNYYKDLSTFDNRRFFNIGYNGQGADIFLGCFMLIRGQYVILYIVC